MHKIFGIKESVEYTDREGAYLILVRDNQVGVIRTPKGLFLLGGRLEKGESHIECIERECIEEAGCAVLVKNKLCYAETYCELTPPESNTRPPLNIGFPLILSGG